MSSSGGRGGGGPDAVAWTAAELEVLRQSIRENGLDDWRTLGDWSQVAAAVGGGKTPEQCFNRWHAEYSQQAALEQQQQQHQQWMLQQQQQAGQAHAGGGSAHHPHLYQQHLLQQQQQQQQAAPASEHHYARWGSPYDGRPSAREPEVQPSLSAGWRPPGFGASGGYGYGGGGGRSWAERGGVGRGGAAAGATGSTGKMAEEGDAMHGLSILAQAASASEEEEGEG